MISISVSGVLVAKPYVLAIGEGTRRKCEFTVFDLRRVRVAGQWQPVWERVVFVAWDEEADRVALIMNKDSHVSCTGLQETHQWLNPQGERRMAVKYRLTAWSVNYKQRIADDPPPGGPQSGTSAPAIAAIDTLPGQEGATMA
jgi:single-stranded DNA-binding protein